MAENENIYRPVEIFWTFDETADEDILKPNRPRPVSNRLKESGNKRPQRNRVQGKKTNEVKAAVPKKQPLVQDVTPKKIPQSSAKDILDSDEPGNYGNTIKPSTTKPTLKDLCADDKKRVANLIKELARLGNERENMVQQLHTERTIFERRIGDLVSEQDRIVHDREDVKDQLKECQTLLTKYQHCFLEQQEKISDTHSQHAANSSSRLPHSERGMELYTPKSQQKSSGVRNSSGQFEDEKLNGRPFKHPVSPNEMLPNIETDFGSRTLDAKIKSNNLDEAFTECRTTAIKSPYRNSPHAGKYHLQPSDERGSVSNRPFTNKIDEIIEHERSNRHVSQNHTKDGASRSSIPDTKFYGIGPLNPPVLSSTQRSEYNNPEGRPQDFKPLQADTSPRSSVQSSHSGRQTLADGQNTDSNNNARVAFTSPVQTAAYSPQYEEERFMKYYKSLDPKKKKVPTATLR